jgi:hypothetical protein
MHPLAAFDQHLDRTIGQSQQLQHVGQRADRVDLIVLGGSSISALACATSTMRLLPCMAKSSAWMDFSRPTNSGITMCGINHHIAQRQHWHCA